MSQNANVCKYSQRIWQDKQSLARDKEDRGEVNINIVHSLPRQQQNKEGDQHIPATQYHLSQH